MKYDPQTIEKIIKGIRELKGRKAACRQAGLSYVTFLEWMEGKIPQKALKKCKTPEEIAAAKSYFSYHIKKEEAVRDDQIREIAVMSIVNSFEKSWQAAAWWLERTDPSFRKKTALDSDNPGENVVLGLLPSPFATGEAKKAWNRKHRTNVRRE